MLALRLFAEGAEGSHTELLWLLLGVLGFFVLAIIVGWVAASRKPEPALVKAEAAPIPVKKKTADDLIKIEGIGPKVAKVLVHAGIVTFDDLANARKSDVQKILDEAGLQMMDPEGWIDQAKLAAKGEWTAFAKLQGRLKGGRKKK